jgi:hypothetical protein
MLVSNRHNVLIVLAALALIATGCNKEDNKEEHKDQAVDEPSERDPANDEMGHIGNGKTERGQNKNSVVFPIGDTGWTGKIYYEGGNNSMIYYDNGTFTPAWNGTNNYIAGVGYYYGSTGVKYQNMQYDCYFRHSKAGNAGGYSFIGIHGWTLNPLVEFYIVDDWFTKPGPNLLGQRKGEFTVDGDNYEIFQNIRVQALSIMGTQTFPQFYSVRKSARSSGHIDICAHFNIWESMRMRMGDIYEVMYIVEAGGGTGTLDCTYFFMSDGK